MTSRSCTISASLSTCPLASAIACVLQPRHGDAHRLWADILSARELRRRRRTFPLETREHSRFGSARIVGRTVPPQSAQQ